MSELSDAFEIFSKSAPKPDKPLDPSGIPGIQFLGLGMQS